ncbi:MAG: helix-turn-helix transcriptional regulator [Selenomonadaceae bacterium]|nr:helix-turn-helix transcriptional regulator [Selenomonadaceae bacterium]
MPKTKDAFAFRDFDGERILQRKFFRQLNLPCGTDTEILNRYREEDANCRNSKTLEQDLYELRRIKKRVFKFLRRITIQYQRLKVLKDKFAENFMVGGDVAFKRNFRQATELIQFYDGVSDIAMILFEQLDDLEDSFNAFYSTRWRRDFGERLRAARKAKGLTQAQLAELVGGVSRSAIQAYESGGADIALPNLSRLVKVLGVETDYLLGIK